MVVLITKIARWWNLYELFKAIKMKSKYISSGLIFLWENNKSVFGVVNGKVGYKTLDRGRYTYTTLLCCSNNIRNACEKLSLLDHTKHSSAEIISLIFINDYRAAYFKDNITPKDILRIVRNKNDLIIKTNRRSHDFTTLK